MGAVAFYCNGSKAPERLLKEIKHYAVLRAQEQESLQERMMILMQHRQRLNCQIALLLQYQEKLDVKIGIYREQIKQ